MNRKLESEKVTSKRNKNRNRSSDYKIIENGVFNVKNVPIGYNWILGYCESSNINIL